MTPDFSWITKIHPDKTRSCMQCKNFPKNRPLITEAYLRVSSFHPKSTKARSNSTHGLTAGDPLSIARTLRYWQPQSLPSSVGSSVNILFLCQIHDEAHFWLNGYVNKQNCRIWSEANPQVYVETPLHPEKLTVWCALWAGGILLQKR
ncbi:hypothetical protein TNCV_1886041 [Trichonephila clavipes]|nr:hypothetical protein TNCV_1886041 [Trichonephila clavipes]